MVILFHLKNLSYVGRRPSDIFPVVSDNKPDKKYYFSCQIFFCMIQYDLVPEVSNFSLCHSAHATIQAKKTDTKRILSDGLDGGENIQPFDLPPSTTDWQSKVRQLNNKSKI